MPRPLICWQEPFGSPIQARNTLAGEAGRKRTICLLQAEPISLSREVIRRQTDKIEVAPFPSWKTDDRLPQEKQARGQSREPGRFLPPKKAATNQISRDAERTLSCAPQLFHGTSVPVKFAGDTLCRPFTPGGNFLEAPDRFPVDQPGWNDANRADNSLLHTRWRQFTSSANVVHALSP